MQFQVDGVVYETREMICLDVDGLYLTVYAAPERGLVFVQTFDEDRGVMIRRALPEQTGAVLALLGRAKLPDIQAHREWIWEAMVPRRRNPGAATSPDWGKAAVA